VKLDARPSHDPVDLTAKHASDEALESLCNNATEEIARIDAALERVENGQFERFVNCEDETVKLRPYTSSCQFCAS
jgi:RNA polymerase-binding transcription factor DksA